MALLNGGGGLGVVGVLVYLRLYYGAYGVWEVNSILPEFVLSWNLQMRIDVTLLRTMRSSTALDHYNLYVGARLT
jgi:hypothetical protein